MRASRQPHGLRGHGLPWHRRRLHHVQGRAHRRGRRASVVALRQQQGRRAGLRPHGAHEPVQRHAGERRHRRAARAHRPRHGDGLRRAPAAGGAARGFRRDRDGGAPARCAGDAAGRGVHPGHRRPGHEVPAREGRRDRPHHAQRGVQLGLRQLHRELRHGAQARRGRVRADGRERRAPRRSGKPLHRVHEQPREAGAEGRRHRGRHRRGPCHLRHQERAVQGHKDSRPARRGHEGHRAGRHVPERRRAARVRAAVRGPGRAPRHRRQHGRVRRRVARPRPLPRGHGARGAQGQGGGGVELRKRRAGLARRGVLDPALARAAGGPLSHAQDRALQGVREPLPAHRERLRRGRGHGQAPPLHHGQPLREGRGHVRRGQGRRAEPLRVQEPAPVRLRAAARRPGDARQRGHPARAQPVRELPVLVHVLHEAGLPRGAVRPVHEEDLRGRHRVHAVRERVLPGQAIPRPHHEPAGQASRLHLVPVQQVGAPGGRGRGQPLQLSHRGQLPRGAAPQHRRAAHVRCEAAHPMAALRPEGAPQEAPVRGAGGGASRTHGQGGRAHAGRNRRRRGRGVGRGRGVQARHPREGRGDARLDGGHGHARHRAGGPSLS